MYHVGPIGLTALVLYLLSLYLSSSGLLSRHVHRRFWNWLLLIAFLLTAIPGIFMALQVNYRWNIPFVKEALHLHVEVGIGMACAAIIHLTWHLRYYSGRETQKRTAGDYPVEVKPESESSVPRILLLITGFVSASVQFTLLREAMILGGGSEASAGSFLWFWLMVSALGAVAGGKSRFTGLRRMMWVMAAAPAMSLLLFIVMNTVILKPGELPSVFKSLAVIAVSVAPAAFVSSFVFIRLSYIRSITEGSGSGNSFGLETLGSVAAGMLTTMAFLMYVGNYRLYILLEALMVFLVVMIFYSSLRWRIGAWAGLAAVTLVLFIFKPDPFVRGMLLRGVRVTSSTDTPYGNISTGTYGGETAVYYDHRPLFFSGDIAREEENIHYTLLQRDEYERVMIISGGLQKHLAQLSKYNIKEVIYIEHDPGIIAAENAHDTLLNEMQVRVVKSDPVKYLKNTKITFDAVIQLIPPATTLAVNRYFTREYFATVKEHLNEGGVLTCTPAPYYNYSPESYRKSFSPVYNSLKAVFKNVTVIPGSSLYVTASDDSLTASITSLVSERGIENIYVSSDYLDDADLRIRGDQIISQTDVTAGQNSVTKPVSAWFSNSLSLELRGAGSTALAITGMLVLLPFLFIRRKGFVMFAASAGLAGFGMIIVFLLQAAIGNMYILSALVLSLLMGGLASGAACASLRLKHTLVTVPLLLALLFILTGIAAARLTETGASLLLLIVFPVLLIAGFLTGSIYRVLTAGSQVDFTGRIYASDLAGSALGYAVVSTVLVPLAGIMNASFILAFFILMAVALVSVLDKR
jgi:spermidine synthase